MIYRFRIVFDTLEEVFRDIEIQAEATLEDLHNVVVQSFGLDGLEMASFYLSDEEWNQGEEIVLFDMSEGHSSVRMMNETAIDTVVSKTNTKLIYLYDFLAMWTFYVELADIVEEDPAQSYPNLMFSQGDLPPIPPEKKFESEKLDDDDDFEGYGEYGEDRIDYDNFDDFDFDQQWS